MRESSRVLFVIPSQIKFYLQCRKWPFLKKSSTLAFITLPCFKKDAVLFIGCYLYIFLESWTNLQSVRLSFLMEMVGDTVLGYIGTHPFNEFSCLWPDLEFHFSNSQRGCCLRNATKSIWNLQDSSDVLLIRTEAELERHWALLLLRNKKEGIHTENLDLPVISLCLSVYSCCIPYHVDRVKAKLMYLCSPEQKYV